MSLLLGIGCLLALQQGQQPLFRLDQGREPAVVAADKNGIAADSALRELARTLAWRIEFETRQLEEDLARVAVDLAFSEQNPRTIAHLIAAAGGADVAFDDRADAERGTATVLHVLKPASADTPSGRDRLRNWAIHWYRSLLADELQPEPVVQQEGMQTRMRLGQLLLARNDLEGAAKVFQSVYEEDRTHPFVPAALLKLAECLFELGQLDQAETWAKELGKRNPREAETAAATVLLGKVLLKKQRSDECVRILESSLLPLADSPAIIDLHLLIGEAHRQRAMPSRALEKMQALWAVHDWRSMSERQLVDYWFLRGYAAEGVGKYDEAMEALEWFLGLSSADPRRGVAFILLGRSYLALGRFLEARAAAIEAKHLAVGLEAAWRSEARFLEANTALALGDRDKAFEELEIEVRRAPEQVPDQILFLADKLIEVGRFQKAVQAAELLAGLKGRFGDQARLRKARALFRQAQTAGTMQGFPQFAIEIAKQMEDDELKRGLAELVGRAYEELHDVERAADAYRGILR